MSIRDGHLFPPALLRRASQPLSGRSSPDKTEPHPQSELLLRATIFHILFLVHYNSVYYSLCGCSLGVRAVLLIRVSAFRQPPREFRCRSVSPSPFSPPSSPLLSLRLLPLSSLRFPPYLEQHREVLRTSPSLPGFYLHFLWVLKVCLCLVVVWGVSPALLICASGLPSALVVSKFIVIIARDCFGNIHQLANPHALFI